MISIAFDIHNDNTFCGQNFSVIEIDETAQSWNDYKKLADVLVREHSAEKTIVIKVNNDDFSINKFAVALFVSSFETAGRLELAVFKVDDLESTREAYKPYLALTVALKYILQLFDQSPNEICKSISILGYLGLLIETDYANNIMSLEYSGKSEDFYEVEANNCFDVLMWVAILKAISLAQIQTKIKLNVVLDFKQQQIDINELLEQIVQKFSIWVK